MSRRTHDRNVSGEYHHHIASVHQGTSKGNLRFPFDPSLQIWARGQRGQHVPYVSLLHEIFVFVHRRRRSIRLQLYDAVGETVKQDTFVYEFFLQNLELLDL